MIREQMSKNNKKKFYIIILFLIVILAYHFLLREYTGDFKEMFSQLMDKDTLGDALRKRYETWSSRVFIEAPLILLAHNNAVLLWKVCNIFVWLALALSLMYLTHYKNITMLIGLILMYPVTDMASAGWIATYINYLWPLTAGCISVIALDKMYYDKKIYFPEAVMYLLLELFATNFETFGVMYVCILLWYIGNLWYEKKIRFKKVCFWILQMVVALGNVIFALTYPGNFIRKQEEVGRWMKDFAQWTVVDKLVMGVNTTMHSLFDGNLVFAVFLFVLLINCFFYKKSDIKIRTVGMIPVVFLLSRTILKPIIAIYFPLYNWIFDVNDKVNSMNYNKACMYFPFALYMIMIVAIVWILLNTMMNLRTGIKFVVLFASALLTRVAMGFSPTLYASKNRTFIFVEFTIIFLIVCIYSENEQKITDNKKVYGVLKCLFICIVGISVLGNLVSINA